MIDIKGLSDSELQKHLDNVVGHEHECLAEVVDTLAEYDARNLYKGVGFASLFLYCTKTYHYSEEAAYKRIYAARIAQKYPSIIGRLERGEISLTAITILGPQLTSDNYRNLLNRASGKSKREVEMMVVELAPKPDARELIRRLPEQGLPTTGPYPAFEAITQYSLSHSGDIPSGPPSKIEPLTSQRIRFAFTGTDEFLKKIERCRQLLRHKYPAGRLEEIFDELVQDFLQKKDPDLKARPASYRQTKPFRREIPQWVKDEVWKRDGGRCCFISPEGRHCGSRDFLEFDHVIPWALGGISNNPGNIRLLCRSHNQHMSQKIFGGFTDGRE